MTYGQFVVALLWLVCRPDLQKQGKRPSTRYQSLGVVNVPQGYMDELDIPTPHMEHQHYELPQPATDYDVKSNFGFMVKTLTDPLYGLVKVPAERMGQQDRDGIRYVMPFAIRVTRGQSTICPAIAYLCRLPPEVCTELSNVYHLTRPPVVTPICANGIFPGAVATAEYRERWKMGIQSRIPHLTRTSHIRQLDNGDGTCAFRSRAIMCCYK